jgi:hypothetical protein
MTTLVNNTRRRLIGAGGGGKGSQGGGLSAKEDPDSLRSRSYAHLIDLLSEGQIGGFVHSDRPLRDIYLDGTPVENAGGRVLNDAIINQGSPILTSASANFTNDDLNKWITGAGIPQVPAQTVSTYILSVDSPTQIHMSQNALQSWNPDIVGIAGALNFQNFDFYFLPGVPLQDYLPGFDAEEITTAAGIQIKNQFPWNHTFTDGSIDALRFDIRFPRMEHQDKKTGDIHGTSVELTFEIQSNAGGYVMKIDDTITGKCANPYIRTYKIELEGLAPPWDIRITRVTADTNTQSLANDTYIDSYTEVTYGKLRYTNSAVVGIKMDAEQFSSVPTRTYHVNGIEIPIPANYDPIARTYDTVPGHPGVGPSGAWDGTFKLATSSNPAWCWYAIATNTRWGVGQWIQPANIDIYSLYAIGQYCDQMVSDGFGGQEPRFTCNAYLQVQADAMQVLSDLASCFRGAVFYSNGLLIPLQDKQANAKWMFSPSNVLAGQFVYSGTSRKARHTVAHVSYNDPNQLGKLVQEYVEGDPTLIAQFGIQTLGFTSFATMSRGQAHRAGLWALAAERLLTDTVTFKTGQEGFHCLPGDVINIMDPFRSGSDWQGRLKGTPTTTLLPLDRSVTLAAGHTYYISYYQNDGTMKTVTVLNAPGTVNAISVAALPSAPDAQTLWMMSSDALAPQKFRILSIKATDKATCEIVALQYSDLMYGDLENFSLETTPTSALPDPYSISPPGAITITEVAVNLPAGVTRGLRVDWVPSSSIVKYYQVQYRHESGNWVTLPDTQTTEVTIPAAASGDYDVSVIARNMFGNVSAPVKASFYVYDGNYLSYMRVTGLEIKDQGNNMVFLGADVTFAWRINSDTAAQNIDDLPLPGTQQDPFFSSYECTVWKGAGATAVMVYRELVNVPVFLFTMQKNTTAMVAALGAGTPPIDTFELRVAVVDSYNNVSHPDVIDVSNPAPPAPVILSTLPGYTSVNFQIQNPKLADFAGIRIWQSADPAHVVTDADVPAYSGMSFVIDVPQPQGTTLYYWIAILDHFHTLVASLNLSPRQTVSTQMMIPTDAPPSINPGSQTFATSTVASVGTTINTTTLTSSAAFTASMVNKAVSGPGIPPNTYITAFTDTSHVTISQNASATGTITLLLGLSLAITLPPNKTGYYTTDGTPVQSTSLAWPTISGSPTQLSIFGSTILNVRGVDNTTNIPTKTATYIYTLVSSTGGGGGTTATPVLSYTGTLGGAITVTLTDATAGATIYYIKNSGATTTYAAPFALAASDVIEYWASSAGNADSPHSTFSNIKDTSGGTGSGGRGDTGGGGHLPP